MLTCWEQIVPLEFVIKLLIPRYGVLLCGNSDWQFAND